jgi:polysaccharide biosynthesis PFTS motif protein
MGEKVRVNWGHSFMYYDYGVVYGDKVKRFLENNRNNIKEYVKTGVLFSQVVRELKEGSLESKLNEIIKRKRMNGKKIISVFDTTFIDWGPLKIRDGIKFWGNMLKLLDEYPDICIIGKGKKEISVTPYLAEIFERLKNHERAYFVARYDEHGISASEVIAASDLVISAAYTSTTAEALGAKIKAIYYDVVGKDIGDGYYASRLPNFVAHSYDELKKLINYWLHEISNEEFENYLSKYIKNEIDPYLDGRAITRFSKLLLES